MLDSIQSPSLGRVEGVASEPSEEVLGPPFCTFDFALGLGETHRKYGRRKREGILGSRACTFLWCLLWVFGGRRSKDSGLESIRILKRFLQETTPSSAAVIPDHSESPWSHTHTSHPHKRSRCEPHLLVKDEAWRSFCPLIKGHCSANFWHTFLLISLSALPAQLFRFTVRAHCA